MDETPRILGLDIGDRRIGVAVSDGLGLTAQPVFTLHRTHNEREDVRSIARMVRKHAAAEIVVGLPLYASGDASPQSVKVRRFAEQLAERTGLPLHYWDERNTSNEAHAILNRAEFGTEGRSEVIDQVAATVILQGYLDARRGENL